MTKVGIISAMHLELENIKQKMDKLQNHTIKGITYSTGYINDVEVVACVCGIGKVNAAIFTQIMIDKFEVDYIINTGIAGSMSSDVKHLDIVVSKDLTYYDVRKEQLKTCYPYQEYFIADENLINYVKEAIKDDETLHIGTIITGDDFIADKAKKDALCERFNALCVEMEGASIAHTAYINQVPFVVIRCISDTADDNATDDYNNFELIAANKASELVIEIVKNLM